MDQGHILGDSIVDRYFYHELTLEELAAFEAHLVDCEMCRDRVLLAGMFHVRNGLARQAWPEEEIEPERIPTPTRHAWPLATLPKRARFVAGLSPWQIWLILGTAALVLVLIPTSYFVLSGK
jgi:hypothetical protein